LSTPTGPTARRSTSSCCPRWSSPANPCWKAACANGKYEVAGFGRNITNKVVVNGAIAFNNLTGFINDPRTYGLQFKALF